MSTIFLDMDGVVADFEEYAGRLLGNNKVMPSGYKYPQSDWIKLRDCERFYRDLLVIPGAAQFVAQVCDLATEFSYDIRFLTAVPSGNDMPWAFTDKVNWAAKHFPNIPVWFGPYSDDKHVRANKESILIDDRTKNIIDWEKAGGIGFLFTGDFNHTLNELNMFVRK